LIRLKLMVVTKENVAAQVELSRLTIPTRRAAAGYYCYVGVGLPTSGGTIISHPFL